MKVLLIGDLRTAYNYGAIATSDALIKLIEEVPDVDLRTIDARSFFYVTPEKGWTYTAVEAVEQRFANRVNRLPLDRTDNIPCRFDQYEEAIDRINRGLEFRYEKKMIEWADIVLINGEGTLVHGTDENGRYRREGRYVLFMAYFAKQIMNRACFIINHSVDPNNRDTWDVIKHVYPVLDGVYVREHISEDNLVKRGITNNVQFVPDALWTFNTEDNFILPSHITRESLGNNYVCIGDSSGVRNDYSSVRWNIFQFYTELISRLKREFSAVVMIDGFGGKHQEIREVVERNRIPSVNLYNCDYTQLYSLLSGSRAFFSGRWHASILSLLGETPVVLGGADSCKTFGLYDLMQSSADFFDINAWPLNCDRIVDSIIKLAGERESSFSEKIVKYRNDAANNVDMLKG